MMNPDVPPLRPQAPASRAFPLLMPTKAPSHRPAGYRPRSGAWDHGGKTAHERGLGAAWQRQRRRKLIDEPLCRVCAQQGRTTAATEVDHITPRSLGGSDDDANLQSICGACHRAKTARERGKG